MSPSTTPPAVETRPFQAETQQLLDLMIHSLYSHKEIFLRELISNASDALDRLRFEALTRPELLAGDEELTIRLETDAAARTLTIHDNGIGMSREEVISNIGIIAKSGTRELAMKLREAQQEENLERLIGQFGVGFYSSFMAADRIVLETRRAGEEEATRWESSGAGEYTVGPAERSARGTSITLHLKPADSEAGLEDFTDEWVISRTAKRYSDFVAFPILLKVERTRKTEGDAEETVIEDKRLNSSSPIWVRPRGEVSDEDYAEFYKHISHDWNEPMEVIPFKAEGLLEYQALLFIPSQAPFDLFYVGQQSGLQLYVRRVLIMERCEQLLPHYLRFLRGVVDSPDLPLNISREMLQHDRQITQIRKGLVKKVLDRLREMADKEPEKYLAFWQQFGRALKEGVSEDFGNREKLLPLLRFASSHQAEDLTSLSDYVGRMQEGQEEIYYLTGESREAVESSPHLEAFRERGYEVLYLTDPVDELLVQGLTDFEDKRLKSVGKGTVELGSEEERKQAEKELEERQQGLEPLFERLQKILDEHVKQVRLSRRLTTSPACLVGAEHDYSPQLERLLMKGKGGGPKQRWILELNPQHEILGRLEQRFRENAEDPLIDDYAELLLGYAYLAEGSELPEPAKFTHKLAELMARGI